jgi:integrase
MDRGMDMARKIGMLSALKINSLKDRGFYCDGGGLYLQVSPSGSKSWVFRFKEAGRTRDMGLGPLHTINLKEARELATEKRKLRLQGLDPIEVRNGARQAVQLEQAKAITFDKCFEGFFADKSASWKNAKHRQQWLNTIGDYASPVFGSLPVQAVDKALVLQALRPIWRDRPETANRLRGRIEAVLDWAKAHGYRDGENPATRGGHLENVLPSPTAIKKPGHLAALPWNEIAAFMIELKASGGVAARAMEFTILTAARTGETMGARWPEIDFAGKVWTVPADRMKEGREHRVPLSAAAIAILRDMKKTSTSELIFPLSNMAMLMLLRRMDRGDITVHGFRSSFSDWAFEHSSFPREIVEAALAHAVGDKAEAAYKRGDALAKRQRLMDAWAAFCSQKPGGKVITIQRAG